MFNKFFLLIILLVITTTLCLSQDANPDSATVPSYSIFPDSSLVVDSILIVGNKTTKAYVILREMTLKQGDLITQETVEYDKNRIYSLQLFNSVEIRVAPTNLPKTNLIIEVTERWYIYPYPIFGIKERDWNKLYYGLGVMNMNFRGRNEKIYAAGTLGYEPSFNIYYRNPEIDYSKDIFLEISLGYSRIENKSLIAKSFSGNYSQHFITTSLTLGKRIGNHHTIYGTTSYQMVKVSEKRFGRLLNPWGQDAYPVLSAGYKYDTRDLNDYTLSGTLFNLQASKFGLFQPHINYLRYNLDYRRFIHLFPRCIIALRAFGAISAGERIPIYNHVYFGYNDRIRGHFSEVSEGENIFGTSGELRFVLLEPTYIKLNGTIFPEFSVWKFGIVAALFGDAGKTWYRREPTSANNLVKGYGAGLHFILPYGYVLRTEYAFNEYREGEFIFDLTASF
jgi:outer membrane protein assembly factor BamA